jgi:hypothetical protein
VQDQGCAESALGIGLIVEMAVQESENTRRAKKFGDCTGAERASAGILKRIQQCDERISYSVKFTFDGLKGVSDSQKVSQESNLTALLEFD